MPEINDTTTVSPENDGGEGTTTTETSETKGDDVLKQLGEQLSRLNTQMEQYGNDISSLKRSVKKVVKPADSVTPEKNNNTEEFGLLQKTFLSSRGVTDKEEVELVRSLQSKYGIAWDEIMDDEYVKTQLQSHRDRKANEVATASIQGDAGKGNNVKHSTEYWQQKGALPTPADIPDRKVRAKIINAMAAAKQSDGKVYYND